MVDILQNKKTIILIIGLGNIGTRHLESLLKVKNSEIFVFDNSKKQISNILKKYGKKNIKKIEHLKDIKKIINFVIVATNSDQRHKVLHNLVKFCKVDYVILEKVVFQKLAHFKKFIKISKNKKIKFIINYPRRLWSFFQIIRNEINVSQSKFEILFEGQNWGLCCNTIHFIDLLFFFSHKKILNVECYPFLEKKIYKSKRKNFYELKGKINYECNNGNKLTISDKKKNNRNLLIIKFQNFIYQIVLDNNYLFVKKITNNINKIEQTFKIKIPKQSEITKDYIKYINQGKIDLFCDLSQAFDQHKVLFKSIEERFKSNKKFHKNLFPIT